jgi:hypothetical protein
MTKGNQIEQRGRDSNNFGPEPTRPVECELALLIMAKSVCPLAPGAQAPPPGF